MNNLYFVYVAIASSIAVIPKKSLYAFANVGSFAIVINDV
jgi:hypothetical protein